jgi:hypothetical protein
VYRVSGAPGDQLRRALLLDREIITHVCFHKGMLDFRTVSPTFMDVQRNAT